MAPNERLGEGHRVGRIGWLRAAVPGANDATVSTARLLLGVAAAHASYIMLAAAAGLVAGAMSMAAGKYVSVHSQTDTETVELEVERKRLLADAKGEQQEMAAIHVKRGVELALAQKVAGQLMAHDALGAHAQDELGLTGSLSARPVQAAFTSAASFAVGASPPLAVASISPLWIFIPVVASSSLLFLMMLGALAARVGGAGVLRGAGPVVFWGAFAMAVTAGVGALFGS